MYIINWTIEDDFIVYTVLDKANHQLIGKRKMPQHEFRLWQEVGNRNVASQKMRHPQGFMAEVDNFVDRIDEEASSPEPVVSATASESPVIIRLSRFASCCRLFRAEKSFIRALRW